MEYFITEILPLIHKTNPNVRLKIIGKHASKSLRALSGNNQQVEFMGFVEDLRDTIADSAVFVVPLRVGGGSRIKILDAMAQGKAIVSTTIGAEGLELTPGTDIIIADSAEDFAKETISLLNDNQRRLSLGKEARATVEEKYSWDAIYPSLDKAYEIAKAGV